MRDMQTLWARLGSVQADARGTTAIEFGMIVSLIAAVILTVLAILGG